MWYIAVYHGFSYFFIFHCLGTQWLSCRMLDSRSKGCRFEPHWRCCIVSFSKTHSSLLSTGLTQEDGPDMTKICWLRHKELNQTNKYFIVHNSPGLQIRLLFRFFFSTKVYVVGTQKNRLNETGFFEHPKHTFKLGPRKLSHFYDKMFDYPGLW